MGRDRNPKVNEAKELFLCGKKLIEISKVLDLPEGTVRRWKSTYKWGSEQGERSEKKKANKANNKPNARKRGAPFGNKNATGPPGNKNAEKHGLFSKYLPEETLELVTAASEMDSINLLWHQITIQYAAIIRSQKIMYVKDAEDKVVESISDEMQVVQQAWDRQANFLQAQARAMASLNGMIKNYEELLHKNWEAATEEQKARIENIKAGTAKLRGEEIEEEKSDDGFLQALKGEASDVWQG